MKAFILVALGGAIGSALRYLVTVWMKNTVDAGFPWHTFTVNVIGCVIIGYFFSWSLQHSTFDQIRLFFMVGILGGFTTYSSFGLETFDLIRQRQAMLAVSYILATNIFGLLGVWAGYNIYKLIA